MAQEAASLPPIRLAAGGHRGQLVAVIVLLIAAIILFFFVGHTETHFVGFMLGVCSAAFLYRYSSKSTVVIFDDHLEFNQGLDEKRAVDFRDIVSVEFKVRKNWANDYYISVAKAGGDERILLPPVYQDVMSPLKRAIIKWYSKDGPLSPIQTISDGSDMMLWKAPRWKIT